MWEFDIHKSDKQGEELSMERNHGMVAQGVEEDLLRGGGREREDKGITAEVVMLTLSLSAQGGHPTYPTPAVR